MARGIKRLANVSEVQRNFSVNRPTTEGVRQSLYDFTTYAAAGQTQLLFFQVPAGQGGKTKADTNMEVAGSLPSPKRFLAQTIEVLLFPDATVAQTGAAISAFLNDTYLVSKSGYLDLFIGSKSYLTEAPIGRFPSKTGLNVAPALADTSTAGASQISSIGYARFAGRPYKLEPPIFIEPTQNFNVSLNWPAAVAISTTARIGVVLDGVLYRNSQ